MNYSVRAFADLTGVTSKALRHYERRGLLAPRRTGTGYRRYTRRDLERLERIIALKSLGLSLTQIKPLLDVESSPLARLRASRSMDAVLAQRALLVEKRERIDRAVNAIDAIEQEGDPAAALGRFIGESAWARWEAKREKAASSVPRAPDRVSASRLALFREIAAALDRDPSGETARPLVARWDALLDAETGGDAATKAAMRNVWANRGNWPAGLREYVASCYGMEYGAWEKVAAVITRIAARRSDRPARP